MGVWLPSTILFHNLPFTHPGPGETTSDCYWPQKQLNSHIRTSFKNATQTVTVTMEQSDYATSDVICILNYIIKQHRATQQFIEPIWQSIVETTGDNNMHLLISELCERWSKLSSLQKRILSMSTNMELVALQQYLQILWGSYTCTMETFLKVQNSQNFANYT